MPWAANGIVSSDEIVGGLKISNTQYMSAIEGMINGKIVTIDGGFAIIDPPELPEVEPEEPDPNAPYIISKMTPWLRMTNEEAETMSSVMDAAPAQLRQIYLAAPYLQSNDPLWPTLSAMLVATFSPERAEELLAPET